MTATGGLAGTTTHWMVNRVLGHTAAQRTDAAMTRTTRFSEDHVFVFRVADLADGRVAVRAHLANFA